MRHFGVEVETYHMDIQAAATVAAVFFGTCRCEDTAQKYRRPTWSAYDRQNREWKFQVEPAVRWPKGLEKCEIISPVLEREDLPQMNGLLSLLQKLGARSDTGHLCAVHVHVGVEDFSAGNLAGLLFAMAVHQDSLVSDFGVAPARLERFCRPVPASFAARAMREEWTIERMVEAWKNEENPKFHLLNILPVAEHGNVEFRLFEFHDGINGMDLEKYVDFSLAMTEAANQGVFAKDYREWLDRIGFTGRNERE